MIVDVVRAWHSKNPEGTVAEAADLLRPYRQRVAELMARQQKMMQ